MRIKAKEGHEHRLWKGRVYRVGLTDRIRLTQVSMMDPNQHDEGLLKWGQRQTGLKFTPREDAGLEGGICRLQAQECPRPPEVRERPRQILPGAFEGRRACLPPDPELWPLAVRQHPSVV